MRTRGSPARRERSERWTRVYRRLPTLPPRRVARVDARGALRERLAVDVGGRILVVRGHPRGPSDGAPLRLRSASSASLKRLGRVLSASRVIFGGGTRGAFAGSRASSRASPPSSVLRDVDGGDRRSIAARRSASSRNLPSAATTTTRLRLRREEAPRRYERGSGGSPARVVREAAALG